MLDSPPKEWPGGRLIRACVTALLGVAAIVYVGFHSTLALSGEDVDKYESPLMLSVGRQLVAGPWGLYGPYDGSNHLVLIHAPLYYRATGLMAWTMMQLGLHPVDAARAAGRTLSLLSLAATMAAAYRLGRLGGLPRRAGWWAALLLAASPVLAGLPVAVRPDMAGVALQSWGVALALQAIVGPGREPGRRLATASALFGLAACVKQHLLAGWAVSAGLAAWAWVRGRLGLGAVARLVLPGAALAAAIYGAEWFVTAGRVWEAAFLAAANVGRVHPGDWLHVATVIAAMVGKSAGIAALAVAGAAEKRYGSPGWVTAIASLLIGSITLLSVAQLAIPAPWITAMLPVVALAGVMIALPGCAAAVRPSPSDGRIDVALGIYCGSEMVLLIALSRSSSGAWINYGIPAVMFAAVLAARSLAGAWDAMSRLRRVISVVAAVAVLASVLMDAKVEVNRRRAEHADLAGVFASTQLPPSAFFFADRPGLNRMSGRLEWVYDDWLYPAFESLKLAEPRAHWLRPTLGPSAVVRAVVLESDLSRIDGIPESLPALGFRQAGRFGSFRVWILGYRSPGAP
jgi:hypothetical protein